MSQGKSPDTNLLRILFRGMVIDAQADGCGVINLTVRTHKQHSSAGRRLLQYMANAVYRFGDLLNPSDYNGLPRVVERVVVRQAGNHSHTNVADFYVVNRLPVYLANGDASYETFFFYEGIENKELGLLGSESAGFSHDLSDSFLGGRHRLNECADNVHEFSKQ
ncbi:hypothetical protein [Alcaligenes aquatilis]|uniref:hypothetical protein n=1 Tax=Alcaligenes aquatilis TaxID=323284 RepID=UPI003F90FFC5